MRKCFILVLAILLCLNTPSPAKTKRKVLPKKETSSKKKVEISFKKIGQEKDKQYRICIGDSVNIRVYGEHGLDGPFTIRKDGTIKYPLLGAVKLEGLTRKEAEDQIYALLEKDYLVDPLVYLTLKDYSKQQIYLLGCVARPGAFAFPEGREITLLQVITEVGGLTRLASVGGVRIIRTNEEGKKVAINPRLNDIMNGRRDDIKLEPNDTIVVPERLF
ncbi:MAG: polysaccharide biosynthesis/export family protein [Candidatus Omnitrophota bacterium]